MSNIARSMPVELVQAEGHDTVRVFSEPRSGSAVVHHIPSFSQAVLLEQRSDDCRGSFCKIGIDAGKITGWVGSKNVRIVPCCSPESEPESPKRSRIVSDASIESPGRSRIVSDASTDAPSQHLSVSSLDSIDASFDSRSFVQYHRAGIENRYEIDMNMIASGGYGKVFKAEDKLCKGRVVAIKKVLGSSEDTVSEFMKEATIMQELDHAGICKIFEVYQDNDELYFVLEYLAGGEVFSKILDGDMTEETIADIIKQVACALKYAHSCGLAHRDLKPENVCFCNHDTTQVKVIDWGLSSDFHKGRMKSAVGSPTYTAPEVHTSKGEVVYTSACDLWSLGVLTYVMLCGKPPFWGSFQNLVRKMKAEDYPMQNGEWLTVSDTAKDFIRRLLKAAPSERMTIDEALSHAFLTRVPDDKVDRPQMHQVLSNMVGFSNVPRFFSLLVASAARQLDHSNKNTIRKVFNELDANHDGVLDLEEVQAAFENTFGEDGHEEGLIRHIFSKLDLDGRGRLSYTEFCAAAMGEDERLQEQVLCLAFNAFGGQGDTGRISKEEIQQLLTHADVNDSLSTAVCEDVARKVIEAYHHKGDGGLDFGEFKCMMHSFAKPDAVCHVDSFEDSNSPKPALPCLGEFEVDLDDYAMPFSTDHPRENGVRPQPSLAQHLVQMMRGM